MEILFGLIALGFILVGGGMQGYSWVKARKMYHLSPVPFRHPLEQKYQTAIEAAPQVRAASIPQEIRDEMEETLDWWDRQYHAALETSGAKVVARVIGDVIEERSANGNVLVTWQDDRSALAGCECQECLTVMRHGGGTGSEIELWVDSEDRAW